VKIYCDGSGFNGEVSRVAAIKEDGSHHILTTFDLERTNNEMEYFAVINGLILAEPGDEVLTDSQLVAYQVSGKYKMKADNLRPLYDCAKGLSRLKGVPVKWIRREQNIADKLFKGRRR
jgi:ribonuclease HI